MRIVFIGAGSVFGNRLAVDVLSREPLQDTTLCLCDLHEGRLDTVSRYVQAVVEANDLPARIVTSTERRELLKDADVVVLSVAIGGPAYHGPVFEAEMGIPNQYGIVQTVGDTMGPGGIFRALRTAPPMLDMMRDINELAPNAVILNYTNPMAILTWALDEAAEGPLVGLCHGVTGNARHFANIAGVPFEEVNFTCAGINHMTWFTRYEHCHRDLLPAIHAALRERYPHSDPYQFRGELLEAFGYYCTESDRHFPEYVPWFQNGDRALFEPHVARTMDIKNKRANMYEDMGVALEEAERDSLKLTPSHESASGIMEAMVTNEPYTFSGNVMNQGLIGNLPQGCCVELPCTADKNGIHGHTQDDLPIQCAALCRSNIIVQELTVEAIRRRSKELAFQALLMDPVTQANVTIQQAKAMFEELWAAESELLVEYD
ncbi:MAG: alpha-glucosidase/alpha-galactosidase [Gemmatimonadetes bacterium]|jgi:alpha-galactosidase|nr:alpha-glucosidase/alpha-galactosidase [Gemmatimonadota bacterium]MBT7862467.1 alpha-glucosidase/alpha-galactosidase [Gemmatimonadota bacterium]